MNLKFSKHNEVHILTALGDVNLHDVKVLKIGCTRLFEDNHKSLVVLDLSFAEPVDTEISNTILELKSAANSCEVIFAVTSAELPTAEAATHWVRLEFLNKKSLVLEQELAFRGDIKETISRLRQENGVLMQELLETKEQFHSLNSNTNKPSWLEKILKLTGLEDSNGKF